MNLRLSLLLSLAIVSLATLSGCSDGRPQRVPVSGKIMIDGEPLESGYVRLVPPNARPAGSEIVSGGNFSLTTFEEKDGATLGEHKVIVIASENKQNGTVMRHFVPEKYGDLAETDLEVEITEPTDSLQIDLTWEGSGRTGPYDVRSLSEGDINPAAVVE